MILDEVHLLGADRGPILEVMIWVWLIYVTNACMMSLVSSNVSQLVNDMFILGDNGKVNV